jgi:hypothetical protein
MKLANPIVHQQQPTPNTCTPTCIAMAIGVPVAELGVPINRAYGISEFGVWLAERGIWMRPLMRAYRHGERFIDGTVYLAAVRSQNLIGSDHVVVVDTRGPPERNASGEIERSGWLCFDPNLGRPDKKVYDWVDEYYALDAYELIERSPYTIGSPPQ